jgi:hypothetical protein
MDLRGRGGRVPVVMLRADMISVSDIKFGRGLKA